MKKKILMACLCVALAVLTIAGTTLAYLTSKDTVTNTFTVGNVAITLDEAAVNPDGTLKYKEDGKTLADRTRTNDYKLMPGHTYVKDPTVHVAANSESSWIFVKVENGIAAFEDSTGNTIAKQIAANGWTPLTGVDGVYYKEHNQNTAAVNYKVFENFKMSDTANSVTDWDKISAENTKVTVNAYAIQKDGFTDVAKAWTEVSK